MANTLIPNKCVQKGRVYTPASTTVMAPLLTTASELYLCFVRQHLAIPLKASIIAHQPLTPTPEATPAPPKHTSSTAAAAHLCLYCQHLSIFPKASIKEHQPLAPPSKKSLHPQNIFLVQQVDLTCALIASTFPSS
jgi:hypothetical protein